MQEDAVKAARTTRKPETLKKHLALEFKRDKSAEAIFLHLLHPGSAKRWLHSADVGSKLLVPLPGCSTSSSAGSEARSGKYHCSWRRLAPADIIKRPTLVSWACPTALILLEPWHCPSPGSPQSASTAGCHRLHRLAGFIALLPIRGKKLIWPCLQVVRRAAGADLFPASPEPFWLLHHELIVFCQSASWQGL